MSEKANTNGLTGLRFDVPETWAHDPDGWWDHLAACDDCRQWYTRPWGSFAVDEWSRECEEFGCAEP